VELYLVTRITHSHHGRSYIISDSLQDIFATCLLFLRSATFQKPTY